MKLNNMSKALPENGEDSKARALAAFEIPARKDMKKASIRKLSGMTGPFIYVILPASLFIEFKPHRSLGQGL